MEGVMLALAVLIIVLVSFYVGYSQGFCEGKKQ